MGVYVHDSACVTVRDIALPFSFQVQLVDGASDTGIRHACLMHQSLPSTNGGGNGSNSSDDDDDNDNIDNSDDDDDDDDDSDDDDDNDRCVVPQGGSLEHFDARSHGASTRVGGSPLAGMPLR